MNSPELCSEKSVDIQFELLNDQPEPRESSVKISTLPPLLDDSNIDLYQEQSAGQLENLLGSQFEVKKAKERHSEESNIRINNEEDIKKIKFQSEQEFARLILKKNPDLIVIYEPKVFYYDILPSKNGRHTIPDFLIINPHNSGRETYVELTINKKLTITKEGEQIDPKQRQKNIMKKAAPDVKYVVLYEENFRKMKRGNPDFDPFPPHPRTKSDYELARQN